MARDIAGAHPPSRQLQYQKALLIRPFWFAAISAVALAQTPSRPADNQLDGSPTLFTVLAAINAAGYDADLDSTANFPIRKQVRDILAQKHLDSVDALKKFYEAHRQASPEAELSQYISFALTLEGPPDFQYHMKPEEMYWLSSASGLAWRWA